MARGWIVVLGLAVGCGRLGYAPPDAARDVDAAWLDGGRGDAAEPGSDGGAPPVDASSDGGAGPDGGGDEADSGGPDGGGGRRDAGVDAATDPFDAGLDGGEVDGGEVVDGGIDGGEVDGGVDAGLPPGAIVQVAAGQTATCVRIAEGRVFCAGANSDGSLGRGDTASLTDTRLGPVIDVTDAVDLVAGDTHLCVRRSLGQTVCWGWNQDGALGISSATPRTTGTPMSAPELADAARLALGRTSSCAVGPGGGLRCVGDNFFGQLGDGTRTDRVNAVAVIGIGAVTDLAGSEGHFCAVHDGGLVSCWGWGSSGQRGDGTNESYVATPVRAMGIDDAIAVGVGQSHSCAVRSDRTLWCWGANDSGQLGDGTTTSRSVPAIVPGLADVEEVAGGYVHTCARRSDGSVHCFGWNAYGQLGDGTLDDRTSPVQVLTGVRAVELAINASGDRSCARFADGQVRCWGVNFGHFGDGTMDDSPIPVEMLPPP